MTSKTGGQPGSHSAYEPVKVSRRIQAPAHEIFQVLANPARHLELDGSQMLRGVVTTGMISGVGDVFVMKMYYYRHGNYEMNNHVVEFEPDRRITWEPEAGRGHPDLVDNPDQARWGHRWGFELTADGPGATIVTEVYDCSRVPADEREDMDNGRVWIDSMTKTLERLDALCAAVT
jgi:hypothetical protein